MPTLQKAVVTASSVNFRSEPSTSSARIGVFKNGAELQAYQYNSDWSYVEDALGTGYVMNKFIAYIDPTVATTTDLNTGAAETKTANKDLVLNYVSAIEQLCAALRKHLN